MLNITLIGCIALLTLAASAPSGAQTPTFDCSRASAPDEHAICSNGELADLDRLVAEGYDQLKGRLGTAVANKIHLPFLRARRACGDNVFCIFQRQTEEIPIFEAVGISLTTPTWLNASPLTYSAVKRMLAVGECTSATIQEISYRLCAPDNRNVCMPSADTGTSVILSNGMYGVSYDAVPQAYNSEIGDPVVACLVEVPKDCPPGDDRGYVWSFTNLKTKTSWKMPDAEHMCGGA